MTAPGHVHPAQPGWWPKTDRVGIGSCEYGWSTNATGLRESKAEGEPCEYGWDTYALGGIKVVETGVGVGAAIVSDGSFNHTGEAGDTVLCFLFADRNNIPSLTYNSEPMSVVGKKHIDSGNIADSYGTLLVYLIRNVAAGTKSVALTGVSGWVAANTISYKNVSSWRVPKLTKGQSSSPSQALVCDMPMLDMIVHALGVLNCQISSPYGGTARVTNLHDAVPYASLQVRDAQADTTFGATITNAYFAGLGINLSGHEYPCLGAVGPCNTVGYNSPQTFTNNAQAGDTVLLFVVADRTDWVTATYDGAEMKYLGRVWFTGWSSMAGSLMLFRKDNVAAGAKTISIAQDNTSYLIANSVSLQRVNSIGMPKVLNGSGTDMSHALTCPADDLLVQAYGQWGNNAFNHHLMDGGDHGTGIFLKNDQNSLAIHVADGDTTIHGTGVANAWGSLAVVASKDAEPGGITLDRVGQGVQSNVTSPMTCTHNATAGTTVYVDAISDRNETISSITYDGAAMTLVDSQTFGGASGNAHIWRYKKTNVAGGSKTISVTFSLGNGAAYRNVSSVSFTGVASEGTSQKANGNATAPSHACTCSAGQVLLHNLSQRYYLSGRPSGGIGLWSGTSAALSTVTNYARESTTFADINAGVDWGSLATPLVPA